MTTLPTQIDLTPFCAARDGTDLMDRLTRPFAAGGWRYATNGCMCVRVRSQADPNDADGADRFYEPAIRTFDAADFPAAVEPWPGFDAFVRDEREPCQGCEGSGKAGRIVRPGVTCERCGGTGRGLVLLVGGHKIRETYARLVAGLPGVRWVPGVEYNRPLPFAFDGGQGVVMGLRSAEAR